MELSEALNRIVNLCETPHWDASRKSKIRELALDQLRIGNEKTIHDIIERRPGQTLDVKVIYPDRMVTIGFALSPNGWEIDHSEPANGGDVDKVIYREELVDGSWEPSVPFLE